MTESQKKVASEIHDGAVYAARRRYLDRARPDWSAYDHALAVALSEFASTVGTIPDDRPES